MKYINILGLTVIFVGVIMGCSKEDTCENRNITLLTKSMEELGCTDAASNMAIASNEAYLIITNHEDYDSLVTGLCHPDIDFSQYQLIIGYFVSRNKVSSFNYMYYASCESNFYKLSLSPVYSTGEENRENTLYYYQVLVPSDETIDLLQVTFSDSSTNK